MLLNKLELLSEFYPDSFSDTAKNVIIVSMNQILDLAPTGDGYGSI